MFTTCKCLLVFISRNRLHLRNIWIFRKFYIYILLIPFSVNISAIRTRPSEPGYTLVILPNRQALGGIFSSRITTTRFSFKFFNLCRLCNSLRYSSFHLIQKCQWIAFKRYHLFISEIGTSSICGSIGARIGPPIRKWPGVSAERSSGPCDMGANGREFKQD